MQARSKTVLFCVFNSGNIPYILLPIYFCGKARLNHATTFIIADALPDNDLASYSLDTCGRYYGSISEHKKG